MGGQAKSSKKNNKPKRKNHRTKKGNAGQNHLIYVHGNKTKHKKSRSITWVDYMGPSLRKLTLTLVSAGDGGFVDLSPQERMKLRMHEKAKKKTSEKYSVEQLLEKVML